VVDLRSDTVTRPTPAMRRAMAEAEVGDDDYGEDPTVRTLEETFAARVGKPAALFVASGVMANQIAIRVLSRPGTAVVAGRRQHVVAYEYGAAAMNAGVQFIQLDDDDGMLRADDVRRARDAAAHHQPAVSLVSIEHTHMAASGAPWTAAGLRAVIDAAGPVPVHMDGARLFNAEVATGVPADEWVAAATTVMCCLSKGLCAPVGSLLAGATDVIAEGRLARKRLGGGMRQAGVLAAPGLVALTEMVERLPEDHARARRLADAVANRWPGCGLDPAQVRTNIVTFTHPEPEKLLAHLEVHGVLAHAIAPETVRFVTHRDVDDAGVSRAIAALGEAPGSAA
jgi:threonine aldolase